MKKFFLLSITLILTGLLVTPTAADSVITDLTWPEMPGGSSTGLSVVESIDGGAQRYSHLYVWDGVKEIPCDGFKDALCMVHDEAKWGLVRVLPVCLETNSQDECIEGLSVTSGGVTKESTLIKSVPGPSWAADDLNGLISGGTESLWSNPFSSDSNVGFQINSRSYYSNQTKKLDRQLWKMTSFTTVVNPYRSEVGAFLPVQIMKKSAIPGGNYSGEFIGDWAWISPPSKCLWVDAGSCGIRTGFGDVTSISLRIHLSNDQTGWLAGRLVDPTITVVPLNAKENLLTISAAPAETAYVQAWTESPTLPMISFASAHQGGEFTSWKFDVVSEFLNTYREFLKDKVSKIIPTWSVTNGFGATSNSCLKSTENFIGLVTTNATTFQSVAPIFSDGTLNYSVASLHFKPDGSLNKGTYDLLLNSKAARCLYNFTDAPIQASVSITSNNGEQEIATTVISEKNGWLHLSAKGFSYSNPTLKVKLSQAKAIATPNPTQAVTAVPNVSITPEPVVTPKPVSSQSSSAISSASSSIKKVTITCVKGSLVKKITSLKPKCPKGYKKKSN
ncbi:MAG: hypothetical protein F2954_00730 [Actinobacteria bacterium]|uniref:Unannotated protein n=1 Tax=freshwater metagenome TaxID=449393 RepID=A0A6J7VU42_9ZZZZ|nr:hypothetical protein [Actinomycetota bacterium]